jgi:hypothetical protein
MRAAAYQECLVVSCRASRPFHRPPQNWQVSAAMQVVQVQLSLFCLTLDIAASLGKHNLHCRAKALAFAKNDICKQLVV